MSLTPPARSPAGSISLPPLLRFGSRHDPDGVDPGDVFRLAQSMARLIVAEWEIEIDELRWSSSPEWLLGPMPESGQYPLYKDLVHPDDRALFLRRRQDPAQDYRIVRTDGVLIWVTSRTQACRNAKGDISRLIVVIQDISERKRVEQELGEQRHRLQMIHTVAGLHALEWDVASDRLTWDSDPESILGPLPVSGRYPPYIEMVHPADRDRFRSWRAGPGRETREFRILRTDGDIRWVSVRERLIAGTPERPERVLIAMQDTSERERLAHLAQYDAVTDLPNRNLFNDRLAQALTRSARDGRAVGLMFLDLDRFKAVNDTLGHQAGDALLKQVADRLTTCLRKTDTVARLGGDEFTVIIEGFKELDQLQRVAEKILAVLSAPFRLNDAEVSISASIGIATSPSDGASGPELIRRADSAMYRAKKVGCTFVYASDEL